MPPNDFHSDDEWQRGVRDAIPPDDLRTMVRSAIERYLPAGELERLKFIGGDRLMVTPLDHRETSDSYHGELFRDGDYRVVVCRDGIQWLFQRQRPANTGVGPAWDTLAYCTTQKALARLWTGKMGRVHHGLERLPRVVKRRAA